MWEVGTKKCEKRQTQRVEHLNFSNRPFLSGEQASVLYVMDADGIEYTKKLFDLVLGSLRALSEFMADHYVELVKWVQKIHFFPFLHPLE